MSSKENDRKAHLLLAAYWGYRVLTGKSIPKTTAEVFLLERSSALKQKREAETAEQNRRRDEEHRKKRKRASAALTGIKKNPLLRKAGKKILKKTIRDFFTEGSLVNQHKVMENEEFYKRKCEERWTSEEWLSRVARIKEAEEAKAAARQYGRTLRHVPDADLSLFTFDNE